MGGGGQGGVVVPADPAAAFEMVKSDTGFQFPVVVFDAPADLREANHGGDRGVGGQVGDPVVGGFGSAVGPFGDQPLFGQGAVVVAGDVPVRGSDPDRGELRAQRGGTVARSRPATART